jgi:hypothetical protein
LAEGARCALEAADAGDGRLQRILDWIAACDASSHESSRLQVSGRDVIAGSATRSFTIACPPGASPAPPGETEQARDSWQPERPGW